jgi:hypothetical protein
MTSLGEEEDKKISVGKKRIFKTFSYIYNVVTLLIGQAV